MEPRAIFGISLALTFVAAVAALAITNTFANSPNPHDCEWQETYHLFTNAQAVSAGGLWGSSDTDIFVGGFSTGAGTENTKIMRWDGSVFTTSMSIPKATFSIRDIYGIDSSHIWAVGNGPDGISAYFFDGNTWTGQNIALGSTTPIYQNVHGDSINNIWAVGTGGGAATDARVRYWDGAQWNKITVVQTGDLSRVRVFGEDSVVITGVSNGYVARYDGTTWTDISVPGETLGITGIWGQSVNDFWVAATNEGFYHYQNGEWSNQYLLTTAFRMDAFDSDHIFSASGAKIAQWRPDMNQWVIAIDNTNQIAGGAPVVHDRIWLSDNRMYVSTRGSNSPIFTNGFVEIECIHPTKQMWGILPILVIGAILIPIVRGFNNTKTKGD